MINHLEHVEDLFLTQDNGLYETRNILNLITKQIQDKYSYVSITMKYDGKTSIVFGYDENDKFFIATKSFFNKTPKLNYSIEDIENNHWSNPSLVSDLKAIFEPLKEIVYDGIYQADLMFVGRPVAGTLIKPNVLEYRIPYIDLGCELGIAVHGCYDSRTREPIQIKLLKSTSVYQFPVYIKPPTDIGIIDDLPKIEYPIISSDSALRSDAFRRYINRCVRNKTEFEYYDCSAFLQSNKVSITNLYSDFNTWLPYYTIMVERKNRIIDILNYAQSDETHTFLNNSRSGPEGYVIKLENNKAVKLVNRSNFSYYNFKEHNK